MKNLAFTQTIAELHSRILGWIPSHSRFRVRALDSLGDYLVLSPKEYNRFGHPIWFESLYLDGKAEPITLNGLVSRYVLLSTANECRYLNSLGEGELRPMFKNYPEYSPKRN